MRGALDLLDLELIFSQRPLLRADEFVNEGRKRGLELVLGDGHLEALHLAGVLPPLYRVRKNLRPAFAAARRGDRRALYDATFAQPAGAHTQELRWYHRQGRVHDPAGEPARPRRTYIRRIGDLRVQSSGFLYSRYQLLLAPELRQLLPRMRLLRHRGTAHEGLRFRLTLQDETPAQRHAAAESHRNLVVALTALETRYLPEILHRFAGPAFDNLIAFIERFDARQMLDWLGWSPPRVLAEAERLLTVAHATDPLGAWHELVGMGRPEQWNTLRGDALVANDHRVAAELLLRFYEDLVRAGAAPPVEPPPPRYWHPSRERLAAADRKLDALLTKFGLSPHPSLVLVLEGETEELLVPRVMELLGIPLQPDFIQLVNARGVDRDLSLLASYVATPAVGEADEDGGLLTRPLTRFLVVLDPEGRFGARASREAQQETWVREIARAVRQRYGIDPSLEDLRLLVRVETWDDKGQAFEFAHFSDYQLAGAILASYTGPDAPSRAALAGRVRGVRQSRGNLKKLWQDWRGRRPTKTRIAEHLWPSLDRRIKAGLARQTTDLVPVARIARDAHRTASAVLRSHMVVVRRR